ncbi:MAG: hypothetical protein Q7S39_08740, partial [Ignavibacteria bacterium]|nr:hypothetical protein [Ignavibacteria bacterium]
KPAASALQFFNNLFSGKYKSINDKVEVDRTLESESEVYTFQTEDGNVIVVSWLKTMIPGRTNGQKDGMAKDNRKETITINIPMKLNGKAFQYDELGNENEFGSVEKSGNKTSIKDLTLHGGGLSIIKIMK